MEENTNKFQRDEAGRIIVPNRPAYGAIALLVIVILTANIMLLRRAYAESSITITANTTEIRNGSTSMPSLNGVEAGAVTVTIEFFKDGYINQYSTDNGENWIAISNNIAYIECKENKKIQARILDERGNVIDSNEYDVNNIDNEAPNSFDYNITNTTSNQSKHFNNGDIGVAGIKRWEYRISTNGGASYGNWIATTETVVNLPNLGFNTTYQVQVRAIDNAGNETYGTYLRQFRFSKNSYYTDGIFGTGAKQSGLAGRTTDDYKCSGCNEWTGNISNYYGGNATNGMVHYRSDHSVCGTYTYWRTLGSATRYPYLYTCSLCGFVARSRKNSEEDVDGVTGSLHCWNKTETVSISYPSTQASNTKYGVEVVKLDKQGKAHNKSTKTTTGNLITEEPSGSLLTTSDTMQNTVELTIRQEPRARLVIEKVDEEETETKINGMKFNVTEVNEDGTEANTTLNNEKGLVTGTTADGLVTLAFDQTTSVGVNHYYKIEEKGSENTAYIEDSTPIYIRARFKITQTGKEQKELTIQDWDIVTFDIEGKLTQAENSIGRATRQSSSNEKQMVIQITNKPKYPSVKLNINKVDEETKEKIKGALFDIEVNQIYDENGQVVTEDYGMVKKGITEEQIARLAIGEGTWEIEIKET